MRNEERPYDIVCCLFAVPLFLFFLLLFLLICIFVSRDLLGLVPHSILRASFAAAISIARMSQRFLRFEVVFSQQCNLFWGLVLLKCLNILWQMSSTAGSNHPLFHFLEFRILIYRRTFVSYRVLRRRA
jgi:hypothetical protein